MTSIRTMLIFSSLLFVGCTHNGLQQSKGSPDERLNELLPTAASGYHININCYSQDELGNPMVDCRALAHEVEKLYLHYPHHQRITLANAMLQFEIGNTSNSQFLLDQLLSTRAKNPQAAVLRARIALEEGNLNLARNIASQHLQTSPSYYRLYEMRAASYFMEGRYNKALKELGYAEQFGAPNWRIYYHRGLIHEAQLHWAAACDNYFKVLSLSMNHDASTARLMKLQEHAECRHTDPA